MRVSRNYPGKVDKLINLSNDLIGARVKDINPGWINYNKVGTVVSVYNNLIFSVCSLHFT